MLFEKEIEAFIKIFVSDLEDRSVAVFAGAGLSKAAGFVDWRELLFDVAEELGLSVDKEHDLISLAQYHVNDKGNNAGLSRKILEEFADQAEESENHKILSRLPITTFWTTNYDNLIESSLEKSFKVVDVKHRISQLSDSRSKRDAIVYKMHGDATVPREAIIYKQQYEDYHRTHAAFITTLSSDLISKTFLFIGFSFTDPNLDYVLSRLRLTTPLRNHYCLMKKVARADFLDDEAFSYENRKQTLRINDLKRYNIQVLQINGYAQIPEILLEIENRFRKKTIFVSGSAEEYGEWGRQKSQGFIHKISKIIIEKNFRIINGFGWGIGSAVLNGALEAIYNNPKKFSEDQLVVRPSPQFETAQKKLPELWEDYRQRMINLAGIAIFVFGNKRDNNGNVIIADGVIREFKISVDKGLLPIPIAATEYATREIFEVISKNPEAYYGENLAIFALVSELAEEAATEDALLLGVEKLLKFLSK